jgi:hypothetical protein
MAVMRTIATLLLLAAVAVLLVAASATAKMSGAGSAAAPFAEAWAHVPRTPADRSAKSVLVFGVVQDLNGFNTILACCNAVQGLLMGGAETGRGAFVQNEKGVWVRDIVTHASADAKGVSYTIRSNTRTGTGAARSSP